MSCNDQTAINKINAAIKDAETELKAKHGWLRHQNTIGSLILTFALTGMIVSGWAYIAGHIAAWACIILVAIFASLTHELEHDLIHHMYFRKKPKTQKLMMWLVWLARPNTMAPWHRRKLHFSHHKLSGSKEDLEERLLGNGMKWSVVRFLAALDGFLSITLRFKELNKIKDYNYFGILRQSQPLGIIYTVLFQAIIAIQVFYLAQYASGSTWTLPEDALSLINAINVLAVVWILPNTLRSFCLNFITSSMHYNGGVKTVLQQCQVLTHPIFWPFQLFCFNFGSTHAMHHFVVGQPFYIRQMIASKAHPVMKENGVRFNELGTFKRANHYDLGSTN